MRFPLFYLKFNFLLPSSRREINTEIKKKTIVLNLTLYTFYPEMTSVRTELLVLGGEVSSDEIRVHERVKIIFVE